MRYLSTLIVLLATFAVAHADDKKPKAEKPAAKKDAPKVTFDDHVLPIFRQRCGSCHNANDRKGNLVLDDYAAMREGGGSGEVLEPGDLESSYLWSLVTHESSPEMPPKQEKLPANELKLIEQWILGGLLKDKGSKAAPGKKKVVIAKIDVSGDRPTGPPPLPAKYLGEPITVTSRANTVTALTTNPWSSLAAVSGHRQVSLFNTTKRRLMGVLPFPEGQPEILRFSRNGSLLLVGGGRGGASGKVVVFDVATGQRKIEVGSEYDTVLGADISPDHTLVALGGPKKMVRVYSTATGELVYEKKKHTDWITTAAFSPDGVLLATGDRANGLVIWEAATGNEYLVLNGHTAAISDVAWRPDGNSLASASLDGTVRLWELNNGREIKKWTAHGGGVTAVDYIRDGRLVSTGKDRVAKLWKGDGGEIKKFGGLNEMGLEVAYDADADLVLAGDWTGRVLVWKGADAALQGELSTNPPTLATQQASARNQLAAAKKAAEAKSQQVAAAQQAANKLLADRKTAADKAATSATAIVAKVKMLKQQQAQANAALKPVQAQQAAAVKALQQANSNKKAVAQQVQQAKTQKTSAVKAVDVAKAAVEKAKPTDDSDEQKAKAKQAMKQLAEAQAKASQAAKTVQETEQKLTAANAAIKPATDNKTKQDQAVAAAKKTVTDLGPVLKQAETQVKPLQAAAAKAKAAVVLSDAEKKPLADAQAANNAAQAKLKALQQTLAELEALTATASAK